MVDKSMELCKNWRPKAEKNIAVKRKNIDEAHVWVFHEQKRLSTDPEL
jgi:hypothetical protein